VRSVTRAKARAATAGAGRKVSVLAGERAARAGPESVFRAGEPAGPRAVPKLVLRTVEDAGERTAEPEEERPRGPRGLVAELPPQAPAWQEQPRATVRAKGPPPPRVPPQFPIRRTSGEAIRSIPPLAGASLQSPQVHRSSWSGFSSRIRPTPGAYRGSRWVSPRALVPAH
jgi:hypothetical protein